MIIVGIDPGLSGGISVFDTTTLKLLSLPTPIIKEKGEKSKFNMPLMVDMIPNNANEVVIENVTARPGQGVTSMFNFGYGLGIWHGIISAKNIPMTSVRPQVWKKDFDLIHTEKEDSMAKATALFPECIKYWKRKKDDGVAESSLIGYWRVKQLVPTIEKFLPRDI